MDLNTAAITGLKLIGYERPLAMWEPDVRPVLSVSGNGRNGRKRSAARHKRPATSRAK
jgi:hypothetical protein